MEKTIWFRFTLQFLLVQTGQGKHLRSITEWRSLRSENSPIRQPFEMSGYRLLCCPKRGHRTSGWTGHALTRRWFQPVAMLLACGNPVYLLFVAVLSHLAFRPLIVIKVFPCSTMP